MTSYFEKLTSINASSLSLLQQATAKSSGNNGGPTTLQNDLSVALDKIEELKSLNSKLELDLKCEHDEKADLVGLKVGLENEVLNLREVNERLEFQVEQLRVEKDKIHNVLARVREDNNNTGGNVISSVAGSSSGALFIAGSGSMKKFPSHDDLSNTPPTSPTPPSSTSSSQPQLILERITEEDETLLESLVMSSSAANNNIKSDNPNNNFPDNQQSLLQELHSKILSLQSENARLSAFVCSRCKRQVARNVNGDGSQSSSSVIFEHDEGLVLTTTVDDDDDGFGDEPASASGAVGDGSAQALEPTPQEQQHESPSSSSSSSDVEQEIATIVEMQRKIIEKLESELNATLEGNWREGVRREVERMKRELELKMGGIVHAAAAAAAIIDVDDENSND